MTAIDTVLAVDLDAVLTEIAAAWSAARDYQLAVQAEADVLTAYAAAVDHGAPAGELAEIRSTLARVVDRRCRAVEVLGTELGFLPVAGGDTRTRPVAEAGGTVTYDPDPAYEPGACPLPWRVDHPDGTRTWVPSPEPDDPTCPCIGGAS